MTMGPMTTERLNGQLDYATRDERLSQQQPDGAPFESSPDGDPAGTLSDWGSSKILADGVSDPNTTRAMGLVPVNALKVTSVVGKGPDIEDQFTVNRISSSRLNRLGKTSDGQ